MNQTIGQKISPFLLFDNNAEEAWGESQKCGWIKDKYGLSWHIIPSIMFTLINGKNPEKTNNMLAALMKMDKLDNELFQKA